MKKITLNELRKIILQEMSVGANIDAAKVSEQANKCVEDLQVLLSLLQAGNDEAYKQAANSYVRVVETMLAKLQQVGNTFAKMH